METVFVAVCLLALMPIVYGAGVQRERHRVAADRKARAAAVRAAWLVSDPTLRVRQSGSTYHTTPTPFDFEAAGNTVTTHHLEGIDVYPMTRRFTKVDK